MVSENLEEAEAAALSEEDKSWRHYVCCPCGFEMGTDADGGEQTILTAYLVHSEKHESAISTGAKDRRWL